MRIFGKVGGSKPEKRKIIALFELLLLQNLKSSFSRLLAAFLLNCKAQIVLLVTKNRQIS